MLYYFRMIFSYYFSTLEFWQWKFYLLRNNSKWSFFCVERYFFIRILILILSNATCFLESFFYSKFFIVGQNRETGITPNFFPFLVLYRLSLGYSVVMGTQTRNPGGKPNLFTTRTWHKPKKWYPIPNLFLIKTKFRK